MMLRQSPGVSLYNSWNKHLRISAVIIGVLNSYCHFYILVEDKS